ncbi:MAG: hypothetical protein GXY44_04485 [Phycisphaerales bacterium]|nr:hypothetical protein [Phycisphaerales bacterium]
MADIRITGLVRQVNDLRRALSEPMTAAQREALRLRIDQTIAQTESILRRHSLTEHHLPGPSRRAYQILKQADLSKASIVTAETRDRPRTGPESVSFRGLGAFLDSLLDDLSLSIASGRFDPRATSQVIRRTADRLNYAMQRDNLLSEQLLPNTRHQLGWFRYFAESEPFAALVKAVHQSLRILGQMIDERIAWVTPLLIHYKPSSYLYSWRVTPRGTRIVLASPMIAFDASLLDILGRQMLGNKASRSTINAALLSAEYQRIARALEEAGGVVERTRGMTHDLADVFDRVNTEYFDGKMARPRLTWNRNPSRYKYGHYDFERDTVCISSTLDHPGVPEYVVESVMHHELLHKKIGCQWREGKRRMHTTLFRMQERTFKRHREAELFLKKLSQEDGV